MYLAGSAALNEDVLSGGGVILIHQDGDGILSATLGDDAVHASGGIYIILTATGDQDKHGVLIVEVASTVIDGQHAIASGGSFTGGNNESAAGARAVGLVALQSDLVQAS